VLQILVEYDWPGNVRELENAIARGVIVTSAPLILPEDLPSNLLEGKEVSSKATVEENEEDLPLPKLIERVEKEAIIRALEKTNGNKTKTAQLLGISRKSLFNKLRYYNINTNNGEDSNGSD